MLIGLVELFGYVYIFTYLFLHNQTLQILPEETRSQCYKTFFIVYNAMAKPISPYHLTL